VAEVAQLEDELRELQSLIETEKAEHTALMAQKAQEYIDTEEELTANNEEICTSYTHHLSTVK